MHDGNDQQAKKRAGDQILNDRWLAECVRHLQELQILIHGFADKRQKSNLAGLFNGHGQLPLMLGTGACNSSGNNFAPFSNELA